MHDDLNSRAKNVLQLVVESYMDNGMPVGSKFLSSQLNHKLSPATIRHTLADLEQLGMIYAPHHSAGRLPTMQGLRFFVEGVLQNGVISPNDKAKIEDECSLHGQSVQQLLNNVSKSMAGLANCAGIVAMPSTQQFMKHIEFVPLSDHKILAIVVNTHGIVENFILEKMHEIAPHQLNELSNYLNAKMAGMNFNHITQIIEQELSDYQSELRKIGEVLVAKGVAEWIGKQESNGMLLINSQALLFDEASDKDSIAKIKNLFEAIDQQEKLLTLCGEINNSEGVQVFIGADNELFQYSGWSAVFKSYRADNSQILGTIGVIGPSRMNYARIIPVVDFTATMVERMLKG